jgi:phosphopantetheinyl transferase (holo-ACP synthase)
MAPPVRIPMAVHTPQAWMDHHFQGRPVLPAVAAMEALARCARENFPHLRLDHLTDARFEKFLPLAPGADRLDAFAELGPLEGGGIQAALLTRTKAPKAAFTRTKVHVRVNFEPAPAKPQCPPTDIAAALEGVCIVVEPEAIYRELVPFGPAFRNIVAPLHISPDGALARIETPRLSDDGGDNPPLLGCGYALDAAFHAACVWAQHYHGVVAFPVAIERRILLQPAGPAAIYTARILPKGKVEETLIFDILLFDQTGQLREIAQGVRMRDVSGGRLTPPQWIRIQEATDPLSALDAAGGKRTVVELDAVADFACQALTIREAEKFKKMGDKRCKSFLAARIALKRLHRRCQIGPDDQPADSIETVCENSPVPCLGERQGSSPMHCSVSHDRRFAIAVADAKPVGVDVEVLSEKALKSARLFMSAAEQDLLGNTPRKDDAAAVRIWSIKECAAKATGMNLAEAWRRTETGAVGERQSALTIDGQSLCARHAALAGHLFTVLCL